MGRWQHLSDQLYTFARQFPGHAGHAGDVAARPVEALDKTSLDWISGERHDDRNFARCPLRSLRGRCEPSHDEIDIEPHQRRGQFGKTAYLSLVRSELVSNASPLDITQLAHHLPKQLPESVGTGGSNHQNANCRHLHLLCPRRDRPHRRRATEQRDELAAPDHSITSSAAASSLSGTVRPSILAVCWLMTSSNLLDCATGKSSGLAPLRMRPV